MLTGILRHATRTPYVGVMLALTACIPVTAPSDADIADFVRAETATITGSWRGLSQQPNYELITCCSSRVAQSPVI